MTATRYFRDGHCFWKCAAGEPVMTRPDYLNEWEESVLFTSVDELAELVGLEVFEVTAEEGEPI